MIGRSVALVLLQRTDCQSASSHIMKHMSLCAFAFSLCLMSLIKSKRDQHCFIHLAMTRSFPYSSIVFLYCSLGMLHQHINDTSFFPFQFLFTSSSSQPWLCTAFIDIQRHLIVSPIFNPSTQSCLSAAPQICFPSSSYQQKSDV
jgi:hypothetical protein